MSSNKNEKRGEKVDATDQDAGDEQAKLDLPKVIVARGTDGLLPREDQETRILEGEELGADASLSPGEEDHELAEERFADRETAILEQTKPAEEPGDAPAGQSATDTEDAAKGDGADDLLMTKILWKGAEALGKGAEVLGNVFGQPGEKKPAEEGDAEEAQTRVISREALNEKLSDMLGKMDRSMLETIKETPGEIKDKLSRMLSNVDPVMLETVQETVRETAAEVKTDLLQILQTLELGTKELEIVSEEVVEPGEEPEPEAASVKDQATAEAPTDPGVAEPSGEEALAVRTRALLEVIGEGDAAAVLDLCRGDAWKRPEIPQNELALVTVQALVTLAEQILDSIPHAEGAAGEALDLLRQRVKKE